ncbi:hypothetical protein BIW11_04794 [Tropilaelaps mercedesae]|uniref:Uncharacterized protein n=1 Tax=Tropilaelaps mercedesae TaxID=418985 RepID=A0A1V9X1N7_9ACAR|nr:hypothetical protein BIW11_04794 [Tropilaelaps mercedesae]
MSLNFICWSLTPDDAGPHQQCDATQRRPTQPSDGRTGNLVVFVASSVGSARSQN